jgi:hypothetical protein
MLIKSHVRPASAFLVRYLQRVMTLERVEVYKTSMELTVSDQTLNETYAADRKFSRTRLESRDRLSPRSARRLGRPIRWPASPLTTGTVRFPRDPDLSTRGVDAMQCHWSERKQTTYSAWLTHAAVSQGLG